MRKLHKEHIQSLDSSGASSQQLSPRMTVDVQSSVDSINPDFNPDFTPDYNPPQGMIQQQINPDNKYNNANMYANDNQL